MRPAVLGLISITASLSACAQLLSYDDYQAREAADATTFDAPSEAAVDANEDTGPPPVRIPPRPSASATPSGKGKTLWVAVRRFRMGTIDFSGTVKDEDVWKSIGFDLDHRCTSLDDSKANKGTCIRPAMGSPESLVDGDGCRDNNFGHQVGTLLRSAAPDTEPSLNTRIEAGQRTWVLRIDDLDVGDDGYAPGALWNVRDERPSGTKVLWDGTDVRMAAYEGVQDGALDKPLVVFPNGYINGDTWVSGDDDQHYILPMTNAYLLPMHLQHSSFVLGIDPDRADAHQGTLVGAFDRPAMEAMIDILARFAGQCPGSTIYNNALNGAISSFDLSVTAPDLQDTTTTCDALSFAVGVDVRPVKPIVGVAPPRTPPADFCASSDAGTD